MIHWVAHYNDNTQLPQYPLPQQPDIRHTYPDIDRDKLVAFSIFKDDRQILVIDLDTDTTDPDIGPKRLIWRMRTRTSSNGINQQVHLAGWQRSVRGKSVQSICYITDEGTVVLSGQWQEDKPLMHAPNFREFELVA